MIPAQNSPNSGSRPTAEARDAKASAKNLNTRRKPVRRFLFCALAIYLSVATYQGLLKPLPTGLSLIGETYQVPSGDVEFLSDVTGFKEGQRVSRQMIFDRVLTLINESQDFVLLDFFLFNPYLGKEQKVHRRLCQEVVDALLEKKRSRPEIRLVVISDPMNEIYGGPVPDHFNRLRAAAIPVVLTDLGRLRDSNPLYSAFWRTFVQWFGNSSRGYLPHPFSKEAGGVSLRSWLALANFKANHRKLIVADAPTAGGRRQMASLVLSANPHDASSAHSNVGLFVRSGPWRALIQSEQAILTFSGQDMDLFSWLPPYATADRSAASRDLPDRPVGVRLLTEGGICDALLDLLAVLGSGDRIDIGMFYLSERRMIDALLDAAQRGAAIRLLLDPNRDAFGYEKNGVPNRPVAAELVKRSAGKIVVRWADTHGEQFHTKMVLAQRQDRATLVVGSANLTRRNIGDYNLETDLAVSGNRSLPVFRAAEDYFERLWTNQDLECSVPYETFADRSARRYWQYQLQERLGLSTF